MSPRVTVSHIPPLRYPPRAVSVVSRTSSLDEDTIQPSLPNSASSAGSDSQMQSSQTPFLRQHSSHSTSPDNAHASGSGSGYSRNYSDTSDATPDYPLTAWGERMRNSDEKRRRERGSPVRRVLTVVKRHGRFVGPVSRRNVVTAAARGGPSAQTDTALLPLFIGYHIQRCLY